jgi:competence protein ComEA
VRLRVSRGAVVVLLLVAVAIGVLVSAVTATPSATQSVGPTAVPTMEFGHIYVHILGEVAAPGLYELREGDRAVDAVAAAGGFTAEADQAQLNLARFLVDGEQIVVPAVGENAAASSGESGGKVNLNSADATQLQALPRIGPAMAQRIIDWRETNGRFASVEDLLSVTGIGAKTFAALKDLVTV